MAGQPDKPAEHPNLMMHLTERFEQLIVGVLLFALFVVLNYVIGNYEAAKGGVHKFLSLPGWLYPIIVAAVGLVIFWFGT